VEIMSEFEAIKQAQEEMNKAFAEFKAANDLRLAEIEKKGFASAETEWKVDKINTSLQEREDKFTKLTEQVEKTEAMLSRPGDAFVQKTVRDEWDKLSEYLRTGALDPERKFTLAERDKTLGGYLVKEEMAADFLKAVTEITPVLKLARVLTTGASSLAIRKKTGTFAAKRRGEGQAVSETTGLTVGAERINVEDMYAEVPVQRAVRCQAWTGVCERDRRTPDGGHPD
jgi:HK97 family phage major capsid protein